MLVKWHRPVVRPRASEVRRCPAYVLRSALHAVCAVGDDLWCVEAALARPGSRNALAWRNSACGGLNERLMCRGEERLPLHKQHAGHCATHMPGTCAPHLRVGARPSSLPSPLHTSLVELPSGAAAPRKISPRPWPRERRHHAPEGGAHCTSSMAAEFHAI